jgi:hypothetical protein
VAALPVSFQVYAERLDDAPQREIEARARRLCYGFLDLLPALRRHRDLDLFFDHCHLRENGNQIVGQTVAERLLLGALADR